MMLLYRTWPILTFLGCIAVRMPLFGLIQAHFTQAYGINTFFRNYYYIDIKICPLLSCLFQVLYAMR